MGKGFTPQAVQHVSVARPRGADAAAAARHFYAEIMSLHEVAPPRSLAQMDLIWFRLGASELHIFPADGAAPDVGQHFCLQVDNIDALRAQLAAAGVAIIDDIAIPNRPRLFCHDPFGNRIECTTILGPYDS